ncbi:hypothetical protein JZ751_025984 [Albula glossodonta]|uniref:Uncharacterized protein n=1 Tax=Albula glossodonta TaxID=121402 RepID=A0A8T2NCX9_9TELE|nr:hypothetical protein JZ751_025984 [Albula glossodonta]
MSWAKRDSSTLTAGSRAVERAEVRPPLTSRESWRPSLCGTQLLQSEAHNGQTCPHGSNDDRNRPVTEQRTDPRTVGIPNLVECELVVHRVLDDQDVGLFQHTPCGHPVPVQQLSGIRYTPICLFTSLNSYYPPTIPTPTPCPPTPTYHDLLTQLGQSCTTTLTSPNMRAWYSMKAGFRGWRVTAVELSRPPSAPSKVSLAPATTLRPR